MADAVRRSAADLAGRLSATARRSATIAQERAVLRLIGVDGLDLSGRPLASSVAEAYCGQDRERLASGVLLPFAVALLEYDLGPRQLALDVASGVVDLGLEAELLSRPRRLAQARAEASRLVGAALARVDAHRLAMRDLRDVLGLAPEPWLGFGLQAYEVAAAVEELRALVLGGADVIEIQVPASWELDQTHRESEAGPTQPLKKPVLSRGRLGRVVASTRGRRPARGKTSMREKTDGRGLPGRADPDRDVVPAGSQRGLAGLRSAADEAAAERGCYVAIMTVTSAFGAPEGAVVAAFERIDMVGADPIREIAEDNVDPGRALADHAFAHRLHARAGTLVVTGAGPLAIGADIAAGVPADAATAGGRALALEALGIELALADGLPADRLLVGAVPAWIAQQGGSPEALVQTSLRHLLFPELRLAVEESGADSAVGLRVGQVVAALSGAPAGLVMWDGTGRGIGEVAPAHRAAADVAAAVRQGLGDGSLRGDAAEQARRTLAAASSTLRRLASEGWESVLGPSGDGGLARSGSAGVVERAFGPASTADLLAELL
jgi:hypothetical protein